MAEIQVAIDRFSELPLEIAHHILSFLPIADVTRVSSLSKRCSRLRLSNPTVNFHSFPSESTLTFQKRLKLWNSLDRFLVQRRNNKHLGEMHRLEQVEISLSSYHVNDLDRVCEQLLHSISSVKYLRLDQVTAKIVFREGFTPAPLGNVCNLRMWIWCNIDDKLVAAMTSLFRAVPNLTTLSVSSYPEYPFLGGGTNLSGFDKGYWELQRFDFVRKLEQVTMELTSGSNGYELAKYLLEHACNLKMMLVITTPDQSSLVPEISRSNRTSNATVDILEKRRRNRTSNTTPDHSSVGYDLVKIASSSCLITKSHVEMNV
ncbi:hypothetical protein ACLB2K_055988 [Fragaria x ananassa]